MTADTFTPPGTNLTDEALVAAIAGASDRNAFAELFRRYAGRVKGFLMKSGAPADLSEEVAQEVMVLIWRKARQFDPTRASAGTWIYTIARNRRIDLLRRQNRPAPDPKDPMFSQEPEPDPAATLAVSERDARVRTVLADLNEDQRQVVELSFYAGLSHGEIAEETGIALGTVKSRMRLALGRLRSALGEGFSGELQDD
ncbi:MAG: sigma-70 family RNA polymerase sigma factor [Pseudomonadota bacterium]